MGKCEKCGTDMYPDVNGDPCCPECLRISREVKIKPKSVKRKKK